MNAERRPAASVIVAVNPHDYDFSVVLDGWAMQAGAGDFEVIVAHNGTRRELDAELRAHAARHPATPVRAVCAEGIGRGALNNAGVRASRGGLLIFSADDSRAPPGFVAAHRAFHDALERPGVGVGPIWFLRELRDDPFRRWLEDSGENYGMPLSQGAVAWNPRFFFVGNASLRRETWEQAGGFDERFPYDMHEDFLFGEALRAAGHAFTPLPRAYALHDHPVDFAERSEAMRRLGATSRMLAVPYDRRGRVSASGPGEIETLRRRYREAEAAVALRDSFTTRRRRWTAGFDLAYAEGAYGATAAGALTLPRSEG